MGLEVLEPNRKENTITEKTYKKSIMKTYKRIVRVFCCLIFLLTANNSFGQLDSSDFSYQVNFIPNMNTLSGTDTSYFHKIELTLLDTVNISKIGVKIGSSSGLGDVEDYNFTFDIDTFLPTGYAYYRDGNEVHLTLNEHLTGNFYFEVKLIDTNGISTIPKKWNTWNQ